MKDCFGIILFNVEDNFPILLYSKATLMYITYTLEAKQRVVIVIVQRKANTFFFIINNTDILYIVYDE